MTKTQWIFAIIIAVAVIAAIAVYMNTGQI